MQTQQFDITKYNKKLGNNLAIFHNQHHLDIFYGTTGWEPHARYLKKKSKNGIFLTQIAGPTVPNHIFKQVLKEVTQ